MAENSNNNFLLTFLAGAACGAVLGLLYAPGKGSETRRKLSDQASRLSENLSETTSKAIDAINDITERVRDIISESGGDVAGLGLDLVELKGSWNMIKGRLKNRFSYLTDNDLQWVDGKEDELIGKLQRKIGKSKDEIIDLINSFLPERQSR